MKYVIFFKTERQRNTRNYYAREFDTVEDALKCREKLIKQKTFLDDKIIYTNIKETI